MHIQQLVSRITNMTELSDIVRKKRKLDGLTQEKLAAISGVGVRFISELERGKKSMELGKVLQVLAFLGLELYVKTRGIDENQ